MDKWLINYENTMLIKCKCTFRCSQSLISLPLQYCRLYLAAECCSQFVNEPLLILVDINRREKRWQCVIFRLINQKPHRSVKEVLSLFWVITMIQLVLKKRDKMIVMSSASVQGIPSSVLSGRRISGRSRRCEEARLRLAATEFLLTTSLKMETGSLRAGLDRFSFHIEMNFKTGEI